MNIGSHSLDFVRRQYQVCRERRAPVAADFVLQRIVDNASLGAVPAGLFFSVDRLRLWLRQFVQPRVVRVPSGGSRG